MDFRILGPLEVRANGTPLPLGGPRQRTLLAVLLLRANAVVARDVLIDELWGERPPATASHTLDAYVHRLRKLLGSGEDGEPLLLTRPPGYLLRVAPGELDADRFQRLLEEGRGELRAGAPEPAAERLDRLLTRRAIWLPTVTANETDLISQRLRGYRYNPLWGPLPDQMQIR